MSWWYGAKIRTASRSRGDDGGAASAPARSAARWKSKAAETTRLAQVGQQAPPAVALAPSLSFAPSGTTVPNLPDLLPANGVLLRNDREGHRTRSYTAARRSSKSALKMELSVYS